MCYAIKIAESEQIIAAVSEHNASNKRHLRPVSRKRLAAEKFINIIIKRYQAILFN